MVGVGVTCALTPAADRSAPTARSGDDTNLAGILVLFLY